MESEKILQIIRRTDSTIDAHPELKKACKVILKSLIKDFNAKRGGILLFNSLKKKLEVLAKNGILDRKLINLCFKRKKVFHKSKGIAIPIDIQKKIFGVIYLGGRDFKKQDYKLLMGVEEILDGRFRYEYDSLGLKRIFSRYLGKNTMQKILEEVDEKYLKGERHNCSIVFADISGFTKYVNEHNSERVVKILNSFFSRLAPIALKRGGTLDKFIGDELMIIFGSPIPQRNHISRAVKTANELMKEMKSLQKKYKLKDLGLSIGIATGRVTSGNIGFKEMMDYTVIGKRVNLAARLTSLAKKNEILVDDVTMNDTGKYKEKRKVNVKDFGQINVYRI